jgi:hypothetical protein
MLRFNDDANDLEFHDGTTWVALSTGGGTVTSVTVTTGTGLSVSAGATQTITNSGTFALALSQNLQDLSALTGTGFVVQTAGGFVDRSITGTAGNIDVTNGDGQASSPTIDLATVTQASTGNFVKVTLDTKGRVTGNTAVTTGDITALVDGTYVNITGDSMSGNLSFIGGATVTGLPDPTNATDAANKNYVDNLVSGLSWKQAVAAFADVNVPLAGSTPLVIDGYTILDQDRVLLTAETSGADNGIYVVTVTGATYTMARASDATPYTDLNGAAVFVNEGTTYADSGWVQTATLSSFAGQTWTQFSGAGAYTGGTGITVAGNVISADLGAGITNLPTQEIGLDIVANQAVQLTSVLTSGQLTLVLEGSSLTQSSSGLKVNAAGVTNAMLQNSSITLDADNVGTETISLGGTLMIQGTANRITTALAAGPTYTVDIASGYVGQSSITTLGTVTTGTWNAGVIGAAYGGTGVAGPVGNGELLIGNGSGYTLATLTAGTGISIGNAAGAITISSTGGTVTSIDVSGGTTGLTFSGGPVTTSGVITMAGTLNPANGGSGLTALGTANQVLGVNAAGTSSEYKTVTAGTGISVTNSAGVITVANTGVTSVALADASTTPIYAVTGSPVTSTGTLTLTLNSQSANSVFAAPDAASGQPAFRGLVFADLTGALKLYRENPSTPVTPVATGTNAVALGSGSAATAVDSLAVGTGANATLYGQKAFANGSFATAGDAQRGMYVLRNITTTNGVTELFLDGASERLVLPDNSLFTFDILVAGRRTDATGGGAGYRFVGVAKKDATAGSITFVGTPSKTIIGETNNAWDAAVTVDTTAGSLRVRVTGETAKTIRWVATVQTTEVTN